MIWIVLLQSESTQGTWDVSAAFSTEAGAENYVAQGWRYPDGGSPWIIEAWELDNHEPEREP